MESLVVARTVQAAPVGVSGVRARQIQMHRRIFAKAFLPVRRNVAGVRGSRYHFGVHVEEWVAQFSSESVGRHLN